MNPSQRRAWAALELGPRWSNRPMPSDASALAVSPAIDARDPVAVPAPAADVRLAELRSEVARCTRCELCQSRSRTVFGSGPTSARWMIVGDAPGAQEDASGEPFVGPSGQLLTHMLQALGLTRERDVFITNALKCHPPENRHPTAQEISRCLPFLRQQVTQQAPRGLLLMGRFAAQALLGGDEERISALRGRVHECEIDGVRVPAVVTFHPEYLLRHSAVKALAWADLCLARDHFGPGSDG
jgi:DNA polymerase